MRARPSTPVRLRRSAGSCGAQKNLKKNREFRISSSHHSNLERTYCVVRTYSTVYTDGCVAHQNAYVYYKAGVPALSARSEMRDPGGAWASARSAPDTGGCKSSARTQRGHREKIWRKGNVSDRPTPARSAERGEAKVSGHRADTERHEIYAPPPRPPQTCPTDQRGARLRGRYGIMQ